MRRSAHIAVRASEASRSKAFAQRILLAMSATIAGVWLALASLPATGSDIQRVAVLEAHVDTLIGSTGMVSAGALQVLSDADANRYAHVFNLQKEGHWDQADGIIDGIGDKRLMGHVLFQRYMHPTAYRSTYEELQQWLAEYADHPGAKRIYRLAMHRKPKGAKRPQRPIGPKIALSYADVRPADAGPAISRRGGAQGKQVRRIESKIRALLKKGEMTKAQALVEQSRAKGIITSAETDGLRASIAGGWFFHGEIDRAFQLASAAADRSRKHTSYADWIAGLAAWRLKDVPAAQKHFGALAESEVASSWNIAAGAFWAARAYLVGGKPEKVLPLLRQAAEHPRTFYGLIASRQLGSEANFDWTPPYLTYELHRRLRAIPAVQRAVALAQAGEHRLADKEIRIVYLSAGPQLGKGLLALAYRLDLPAMQLRLARGIRGHNDRTYDGALYPLPPWQPEEGFKVDQALLYAFMRQESGFDASAQSWVGARGLMQLMPRTASFVANDRSLRSRNKAKLFDPEFNVGLGQKYLTYLLEHELIKGDLFKLAVAYNAGPGNLQRWLGEMDASTDPLTFIESIPSRETRIFVEKVLSNFWIYRQRMQQDSPSLDAIASGFAPVYLSLDATTVKVAANARR